MSELTYYDYINAFYDLLQTNPLSSNAQLLYHTLLMIFNKSHWENELQRTNYSLCSLCGLGEKAMTNARNELKQANLIDFKADRRRGQATKYKICTEFCTVKNAVQTQNKGSTNAEQTQNKGRTYKDKRDKIKDIKTPNPFTGEMAEKFDEWLAYKRERGQVYKPTGLNGLINKIQKGIDTYGQAAIMSAIDNSISNNWQGLFFDKIDRSSPERSLSVYNSDIDYEAIARKAERA